MIGTTVFHRHASPSPSRHRRLSRVPIEEPCRSPTVISAEQAICREHEHGRERVMERAGHCAHHDVSRKRSSPNPRPERLHAARALQPGLESRCRQERRRDLPAGHRSGDEGANAEHRRQSGDPAGERRQRDPEIGWVQAKTPGQGPGFVFRGSAAVRSRIAATAGSR